MCPAGPVALVPNYGRPGAHLGTVGMLDALRRARQRINLGLPAPVQRLHAPDRETHRSYAKTAEIREPALRSVFLETGTSSGSTLVRPDIRVHCRLPNRILRTGKLRRKGMREAGVRFAVMITPDGRPDATPRTAVSSGGFALLDRYTSSLRGRTAARHGLGGLRQTVDPTDEVGRMAQQWTRADERESRP